MPLSTNNNGPLCRLGRFIADTTRGVFQNCTDVRHCRLENNLLTFHQIQARVRHQLNWFQHQNHHQKFHRNKIRLPHQKSNTEPEADVKLKAELESKNNALDGVIKS